MGMDDYKKTAGKAVQAGIDIGKAGYEKIKESTQYMKESYELGEETRKIITEAQLQ